MPWQEFSFSINGFPVMARFTVENLQELFQPLVLSLDERQRNLGKRLTVFLAAPPGTGKSTLGALLSHLSQTLSLSAIQPLGLDGFHYPQAYILSHEATDPNGKTLPMKQVKGSPETYDTEAFTQSLQALRYGGAQWPVYDRRLHDVAAEKTTVTAPIALIEGNWLLLREKRWALPASLADVTLFIRAEEQLLQNRLIARKIQGGLTEEEAAAFYLTGDGPNIRRVLEHSREADLTLALEPDGSFSLQNGISVTDFMTGWY